MITDNFITEILKVATKRCGGDFGSKVSDVLKSNESALKESWQSILPTDLTTNDRNNLSIDTKFEIILTVSQD